MADRGKPTSSTEESVERREVADRVLSEWRAAKASVSPVLGQDIVRMVYARCLVVARAEWQWLPAPDADATLEAQWSSLHAAMALQTGPAASTAAASILSAFCDVFISLIGPSLTAQLLGPAPPGHSSGKTAKDVFQ